MSGVDMEQMFLENVLDEKKEIAEHFCEEIRQILEKSQFRYDLSKIGVKCFETSTETYYTVQFFERSCIHVKGKNKKRLEICPMLAKRLEKDNVQLSKSAGSSWGRISFEEFSSLQAYEHVIEELYEDFLKDADPFGCCSHYLECSDAKDCIKDDIMFAGRCAYRQNLKAGKIFYGKNATI